MSASFEFYATPALCSQRGKNMNDGGDVDGSNGDGGDGGDGDVVLGPPFSMRSNQRPDNVPD